MSENIIDENSEMVETPKKKRGRPKKNNPYREFQDYMKEIFEQYTVRYKDMILEFCNDTDNHISKTLWNRLNAHVKEISDKLSEKGSFNSSYTIISYKPMSVWKLGDTLREQDRKRYVKLWLDRNEYEPTHRGFMIFSHIKSYIQESCKEFKI